VKYDPHHPAFWDSLDIVVQNERLAAVHEIALSALEATPFWRFLRKRKLLLAVQILRACELAFIKGCKVTRPPAARPQ
jgi:hypothetical protein